MSLAVDGGDRRRGHSRSRSRDARSKDEPSRDKPSAYADVREPSYVYPEDDLDDRYKPSRRRKDEQDGGPLPYPSEGGIDSIVPGSQSLYSYDSARPIYRTASPPRDSQYRSSNSKVEANHLPGSFPEEDGPKKDGDDRRVRYAEDRESRSSRRERSDRDDRRPYNAEPLKVNTGYDGLDDEKLKFLPQKYSRRYEEGGTRDQEKRLQKEREEQDLAYGHLPPTPVAPGMPPAHNHSSSYGSYGGYPPDSSVRETRLTRYVEQDEEEDYRRRQPPSPRADDYDAQKSHRDSYRDGHRSSKSKDFSDERRKHTDSDRDDRDTKKSSRRSYREDPRESKSSSLTVDGGRDKDRTRERSRDGRRDKSPGPATLGVESSRRDRSRSRDGRSSHQDKSLQSGSRTANLMVDTGRPLNASLAAAPGSPLLESYHGTYQDCSPMPSPLLLASKHPADLPRAVEQLSPLNSDVEGDGSRKKNRRARFHDAEDIASRLARALKGDRGPPDIEPLIEILPSLSHEQVMELRTEYKHLIKTGADRKGVNIAKHIRARLKDEDPILMKACYSVALGQWESEAYWANFWYQGDKTRRELLIESLMGRTNEEIRRIKDSFTDKKYDNSLTKCMKMELKEDKFKKAVLMVLEERRMEDYDYDGHRIPIDQKLVEHDADDLYKAVRSDKGGETAMIAIVVQRSDSHLRAVIQEYERHYRSNFARDALKKSGNLVGELLAHILNGVINRPVRDALLLNHALTASRKDQLRRELLISRLVRFHWDPLHMQDVKKAYRERYGQDLQEAVREATSGEWGLFCRELCIARMPNDVRRMERVEVAR